MTIYVTGHFAPAELGGWAAALQQRLPEERILTVLEASDRPSVDIAVVANPAPGALAGLPALRLIQSVWAGVDRLLADPSLPPGVPVARMVDPVMTAAMTETGVWAVLGLHRGFFAYAHQQAQRLWRPRAQRRADECRVLVLGQGELGGALSQRLRALGYPVTGWRQRGQGGAPGVVSGERALAEALGRADVVVNLLPLTPATEGLLNAERLARLPVGAGLVNLARGAHVVESDLLAALADGHLSHAVLDVFAQEPLPSDHPFWHHPRVTVLPHVAAQTDVRSAADQVAFNVRALRAGRPLRHRVARDRGY